jgi:16S rRNA (uracil1498-N3)-methyltransferase
MVGSTGEPGAAAGGGPAAGGRAAAGEPADSAGGRAAAGEPADSAGGRAAAGEPADSAGGRAAAGERVADGLRRAAAHVFVDDLDGLDLRPDDADHLGRVLRLRPGEAVGASDGAGGWRLATWDGAARLREAGPASYQPRPSPVITVGLALIKGDRLEWAAQKLTELGVDRIVPLVTDRSVVRWDESRRRRGVQRLRSVARAAGMQSRRVWLPAIDDVHPLSAFTAGAVAAGTGGPPAALAAPGGEPPALRLPTVLIGPEGGWSPAEEQSGLPAVGLGPQVLRSETAAIVAGCLLTALRAGLVESCRQSTVAP